MFNIDSFSSFGISGSRHASGLPVSLARVVVPFVSAFGPISCGDAHGVDDVARPFASFVFHVSDFGVGRGAYARRSIAFVRDLSLSPSPILLAFPSDVCPIGLFPSSASSRCFCGLGSGTWASVSFAIGLRIPVIVFGLSLDSLPIWDGSWSSVVVGSVSGFLFVPIL